MYSHFLHQYGSFYPQISRLIVVATAVPVSSVSCERGFSAANRIKTKLRNRLTTQSVCRLMMISVEGQPIGEFNFQQALLKFKNRNIVEYLDSDSFY